MKINDAIFGVFFMILALTVLITVQSFPTLPGQPYGPATFPRIIAFVMLCGGFAMCVSGVRQRKLQPLFSFAPWIRSRQGLIRMACVPLMVLIYIWLSGSIGFPILVPCLLFAFLWVTTRQWVLSITTALLTTTLLWLFFARLLLVPLPLGILTKVIY